MNPPTTAEVLAHTTCCDHELVTLQLEYPRIIHAQFLTYGLIRRNTSSSRAVPVKRTVDILEERGPYIPEDLLYNKAGMKGGERLSPEDAAEARSIIEGIYAACLDGTKRLEALKLHKQDANRYLDYFTMVRVIATAARCEWDHFLAQRDVGVYHAQPAVTVLAQKVREALEESVPVDGVWHVPWAKPSGPHWEPTYDEVLIACGRAARVSYARDDVSDDFKERLDRFLAEGHTTPFDHVAVYDEGGTIYDTGGNDFNIVTPYSVAEFVHVSADTRNMTRGWVPISALVRNSGLSIREVVEQVSAAFHAASEL